VRHQWQRQAGKAAGAHALAVVMVLHDWAVDAGAGVAAAAGIGDGTVSTASEGGNGEP